MGLMDFLMDTWKKTENIGPLEHRLMEKVAKRDSQTAAMVGNKLGWQWLENQGKQNEADPTRALAHGAIGAAAYFAAPYLWGQGAIGKGAVTAGAEQGLASSIAAPAVESGITSATQDALLQQAQQQAARQAMQQAAEEAAQQGAQGSGGLFGQVPGAGPQQTSLLNAQTADFGGPGADLTAKSAMPAVRDAYRAGSMGQLDYMGNVMKADAAGMNDPSVWASRAGSNLDRLSSKSAQNLAMKAFTPQQPTYQPPPGMPQQQQSRGPEQIVSPEERQRLMDDYNAGRISEGDLRRRLGVYA
jgi:hypothetical protein